MFGYVVDDVVLVDYATESMRAELGPTWLRFDEQEISALEESYARACIGDWHLHPGEARPDPSSTDRDSWGVRAGKTGHPWASIVVGDNGSPYWPMRAFVTLFHGGNSRTYPATLIEEGY